MLEEKLQLSQQLGSCSSSTTILIYSQEEGGHALYIISSKGSGDKRKEEINWLNFIFGAINHVLQFGDRMLHQSMAVVVMQWVSTTTGRSLWCSMSFPWRFNSKFISLVLCHRGRFYFSYIVTHSDVLLA